MFFKCTTLRSLLTTTRAYCVQALQHRACDALATSHQRIWTQTHVHQGTQQYVVADGLSCMIESYSTEEDFSTDTFVVEVYTNKFPENFPLSYSMPSLLPSLNKAKTMLICKPTRTKICTRLQHINSQTSLMT